MRFAINILVLILLFEIASGIFSGILPNYRILLTELSKKNNEQQKLEKIKATKDLFNTISQRSEIKGLDLSRDYFEIYLPTKFKDYELTAILFQLLKKNGFSFKSLDFKEAEDIKIETINLPLIKKVKFSLVIDGQYNSIMNFIQDLENNSRIFYVDKITLSRSSNGVSANLELSSFYLKPIKISP
ncbi:MAG: hypothetical protein AAB371_00855 [Patescibacteria group bacterium]